MLENLNIKHLQQQGWGWLTDLVVRFRIFSQWRNIFQYFYEFSIWSTGIVDLFEN